MRHQNLEVILVLGVFFLGFSNSAPIEGEDIQNDIEILEVLLQVCRTHPGFCKENSQFYDLVRGTIRHYGVKKKTALFMTDALFKLCLLKGAAECDKQDTIKMLNLLSRQQKTKMSLEPSGKAEDQTLSKTNNRKYTVGIQEHKNGKRLLKQGSHHVERRAVGSILSLIQKYLCNKKPGVCRDELRNTHRNSKIGKS